MLAFCLAVTAWVPLNGTISRREREAEAEEFQLVIPIAEIVSANLFDPDVYAIFREIDEAPFPTVAAGSQ